MRLLTKVLGAWLLTTIVKRVMMMSGTEQALDYLFAQHQVVASMRRRKSLTRLKTSRDSTDCGLEFLLQYLAMLLQPGLCLFHRWTVGANDIPKVRRVVGLDEVMGGALSFIGAGL